MVSRFTSSRFTFIVLIVLGTALLTVGLAKDYLDTQVQQLDAGSWMLDVVILRGACHAALAAVAQDRPLTSNLHSPPTATTTPTAVPPTPTTAFSPAPSVISPTPTATPSPTSTPTAIPLPTYTPTPLPTYTPTPSRPPPATAPPDRIVIPAIGLDAPVVPVGWTVTDEGPVWEVADYAAGWHNTSAYPGHVGNTVLSGHHNIEGRVFRYLIDVEPDNEVILYVGEVTYHYVVTEKHLLQEKGMPQEVRRSNAQWIAPTDDERVTLVTCWPYTSNTHRLIVVAKPVWKLEIGG